MAVAQHAERYYDPETILTQILQEEDPKGVMQKRYYFMAEEVFPNIRKHRVIMNLLEMAEDGDESAEMEARLAALEMGVSIEQIKQGNIQPPPKPTNGEKPPRGTEDLLGKSGEIGGIPRESIGTAQQEEGESK